MQPYRTESCVLTDPETLRRDWLGLQDRADCSFFLSWGWIGTWLQHIALALNPVVVRVWHGEDLVGLSLFVPREIRRRAVFHASALFLNEYPFDHKNMVIEYNGLLVARGHESAVYTETVSYLFQEYRQYDEFHFGAITAGSDLDNLEQAAGKQVRIRINEESTAWQVELESLESGVDAFLATLSKNRRTQLRRSIRLYEQQGPLELLEARDVEQALAFFDGLKVLHTERLQLKGEGGSFSSPCWEAFHRSLIKDCFSAGEIQLIRVNVGGTVVGYLYNLAWRKQVYVLQTGFLTSKDKRDMPGYVVHALAIAHNRDKGMVSYDLMHGDSLYKRILCNRSCRIYWITLQRKRPKFLLENLLLEMVRGTRRVTGA